MIGAVCVQRGSASPKNKSAAGGNPAALCRGYERFGYWESTGFSSRIQMFRKRMGFPWS